MGIECQNCSARDVQLVGPVEGLGGCGVVGMGRVIYL